MLTPIPGFNHLKTWKPTPQQPTLQTTPETKTPQKPAKVRLLNQHAVHHIINTALEVATGIKPINILTNERYHPSVLRHITARRRYQQRGPATITSMHAHQQNPTTLNISGACQLAGKTYAYAAKIQFTSYGKLKLAALRIL